MTASLFRLVVGRLEPAPQWLVPFVKVMFGEQRTKTTQWNRESREAAAALLPRVTLLQLFGNLAFLVLRYEEEIEILRSSSHLILNYSGCTPRATTGKMRPKIPIRPISPTCVLIPTLKKAQSISWCTFCFFSVWLKMKLVALLRHKYVIWLQCWLVFALASKSQGRSNPIVLPSTFFTSEEKTNL